MLDFLALDLVSFVDVPIEATSVSIVLKHFRPAFVPLFKLPATSTINFDGIDAHCAPSLVRFETEAVASAKLQKST